MKENYFDEESWSEKFINAREKDKMTIFNKVMDELEPLTDAFLDKADEVIKEETHNERLFFIGERDFTEKMNNNDLIGLDKNKAKSTAFNIIKR